MFNILDVVLAHFFMPGSTLTLFVIYFWLIYNVHRWPLLLLSKRHDEERKESTAMRSLTCLSTEPSLQSGNSAGDKLSKRWPVSSPPLNVLFHYQCFPAQLNIHWITWKRFWLNSATASLTSPNLPPTIQFLMWRRPLFKLKNWCQTSLLQERDGQNILWAVTTDM